MYIIALITQVWYITIKHVVSMNINVFLKLIWGILSVYHCFSFVFSSEEKDANTETKDEKGGYYILLIFVL